MYSFDVRQRGGRALGRSEETRVYYKKLVELGRQADTERAELAEAKAFLAKK
jgi:hypothetical protein